jgi:hypothetical protein
MSAGHEAVGVQYNWDTGGNDLNIGRPRDP